MVARSLSAVALLALQSCVQPPSALRAVDPWYPALNPQGHPVFAVFEGRIPCNRPEFLDCDKIKVSLVLYKDGRSETPSTYALGRVYVAATPEGSLTVVAGAVSVTHGTALDPAAMVYRLDAGAPREFRAYWTIGRDILFILDEQLYPRVGTAGWSYVLNRTR
jgi:hypothetical protein